MLSLLPDSVKTSFVQHGEWLVLSDLPNVSSTTKLVSSRQGFAEMTILESSAWLCSLLFASLSLCERDVNSQPVNSGWTDILRDAFRLTPSVAFLAAYFLAQCMSVGKVIHVHALLGVTDARFVQSNGRADEHRTGESNWFVRERASSCVVLVDIVQLSFSLPSLRAILCIW